MVTNDVLREELGFDLEKDDYEEFFPFSFCLVSFVKLSATTWSLFLCSLALLVVLSIFKFVKNVYTIWTNCFLQEREVDLGADFEQKTFDQLPILQAR